MSEDLKIKAVKEDNVTEENNGPDLFERAFGKEPKVGYDFKSVEIGCYWRAIVIRWSATGIGFGEIALVIEDKKIKIDTECMSKEFCDALIAEAVKKIKAEETNEESLTEEEEIYGREGLVLRSNFLQTMYNNVDWETEINPYVSPEGEETEEEKPKDA